VNLPSAGEKQETTEKNDKKDYNQINYRTFGAASASAGIPRQRDGRQDSSES